MMYMAVSKIRYKLAEFFIRGEWIAKCKKYPWWYLFDSL